MKTLLITTAFLTAPMVGTVSAQTGTASMKLQIAEQNRQIIELEKQVTSLQSQLNLERSRSRSGQVSVVSAPKQAVSLSEYTVIKGDNFTRIAKKNGVTLAALITANKGVSPNKISIGQKLNIPKLSHTAKPVRQAATSTPAAKPTRKAATGTYKISKGDTFYSISKKNNVSIADLIDSNPGINPAKIQIGQTINLSKKAIVVSQPKKTQPAREKTTVRQAAPVKQTPKKEVVKREVATQPLPPVVESKPVRHVEQEAQVARTVKVSSIMTYGDFARKNGTTTAVLNSLNGLDLPADEPMAVGSELYVPNNY